MRVLWIVNIIFPEVAQLANRKAGYGGGWIPSMADRLRTRDDIKLAVAIPGGLRGIQRQESNGVLFYVYPGVGKISRSGGGLIGAQLWKEIVEDFNPDIIHAYGTEYVNYLELIRNCVTKPIVISLQGILTEYYKHYYGGMDIKDVLLNVSLSDMLLMRGMVLERHRFKYNSRAEQEILSKVKYVEGRTLWDKTAVLNINNSLKYYHCPRMIRKEFYYKIGWEVSNIERHSIFIHQATYPIKCLHFMLDALAILRDKYPDIKLYIAGTNILDRSSFKNKLVTTGYSSYIRKKIKKLRLKGYIHFTGVLDAQQLVNRLKISHVMVIPSAIENSPNSLAEAMLVGTPCVASFVGGNPEMIENNKEGFLYTFNEPAMLAIYISKIFESDELAQMFSNNARATAMKRHDPEVLERTLVRIYTEVINDFSKDSEENNLL